MVESTALEMRRTRKGTVGSNPTLSAIKTGPFTGPFFVEEERVERTHVRQNAVSVLGRAVSPPNPQSRRPADENRPEPVFANPTLSATWFEILRKIRPLGKLTFNQNFYCQKSKSCRNSFRFGRIINELCQNLLSYWEVRGATAKPFAP